MKVTHYRPTSVHKVTAGIVLTIAGIVVVTTLAVLVWPAEKAAAKAPSTVVALVPADSGV